MMMQWFVNEVREKLAAIDSRIERWVSTQIESAERLTKIEGELKAMKARMGKTKE
jgi:hypothetical protein